MASDVNTKPPQVYQKAFLLHHSGLVKNLTPQEVLDVAFAKGLISLEEKTRVAAERTDFDRVDQLLIVFHRRYASDTTVFKRLYEVVQQVNEEESGALSHVVNDLKATIDGNMVGDVTIPQGPLSDEDASSIAASEEVLKKSFEVKQVLPELISAGVITWEEHEKINEPVDFEERVAKFLQFLRQRGSAAFSRFVEVLDETEIYKKLADDLRKDHTPQPKSSTKMETDEAKGTMIHVVLCTSCTLSQFESPLPRFLSLYQMVQAYVRQRLLMIKVQLYSLVVVVLYLSMRLGRMGRP